MRRREEWKEAFLQLLRDEERSRSTIEKYNRDVSKFLSAVKEITKEEVLRYKETLGENYAVSSTNSMLVAMNRFLRFIGREDLCVRLLRTQQKTYRDDRKDLTKTEYRRLLRAARTSDRRLYLLMETICSTGIRVSEHRFITAECLRRGYAEICNKGKRRVVFLEEKLCRELKQYCKTKGIRTGAVFRTDSGKVLDRSRIWRLMKNLSTQAGVAPEKIYPHNLRHLFAVTFYKETGDIVRLADVLGHTSINTTRIYTSISIAAHREQLARMRLLLC